MVKGKNLPQIYDPTQGESDLPRSVHPQWGQPFLTMTSGAQYNDESQHIGDNYFSPLSSLESVIEQIKKAYREDHRLIDILDELASYITEHPEREVIGLEEKLKRGKRTDLLKQAKLLKNQFERRVAKNQMSRAEQYVYIQILSHIKTIWEQLIHPKIITGAPQHEIDRLILDELVNPVHRAIARFDLLITSETVRGMLYFLTGKCHLIWEPEC